MYPLRLPSKNPFSSSKGFTVVELFFVIGIIGILVIIALPMYRNFIQKARETSVVAYLSKVKRAQELYRLSNAGGLYSGDFDELELTGAIPPSTGSATRDVHEYRFTLASGVDAGTGAPYWNVSAEPLGSSTTSNWFYIDETGVARYSAGAQASAASPPYVR